MDFENVFSQQPRTEKPYLGAIHSKDQETLDRLTEPRNWDYAQFRSILVALAKVSNAQSITARNRPNSIHLQGWRKCIDDLVDRSRKSGKEHARVILADTEKDSLVVSGKITIGSRDSVRLDVSRQPGREKFQKAIASLHVHPDNLTSHGLSGQDYKTFLSDSEQQVMMIAYGKANRIMVLKTTVTPNNLDESAINRHIEDVESEYINNSNKHPVLRVVDFNKSVCSEFGLVMYMADEKSSDLFERVNVTQ